MRKVILKDRRKIFPFNEPARNLRILNKPLWLHHRDILARYVTEEYEVNSLAEVDSERVETLVYRNNLFFDRYFLDAFIKRARRLGKACRVAFSPDDRAINAHARYLQQGIHREGDLYVAPMWYFPHGIEPNVRPLVMDTGVHEMGYYHVPTHMSNARGDLAYQVPTRAICSIEHWVHTITANVIFGTLANGARMDIACDGVGKQLELMWRAMVEKKNIHSSSAMVRVGRNCSIDPTATIKGPTYIGDNVSIGPGSVVDVSVIGNNVNIMQGCQVQWSVISDRCYLPFRAAVFASVIMADSMVAQNTCVQFCSIGRNTFLGAGNTFTDFNLVPKPIRTMRNEQLESSGMQVLGGCVGHNCFLGSGMIVYPARVVESDVVLVASDERRVIARNVMYEESDHFKIKGGEDLHQRLYPR